MSEPLSQKFVTAFLTTCFDAGLSKEAAAELLQKESVDRELAARPAFAEGYIKQASAFPGGLQPMLFLRGMEKAAMPLLHAIGRGIQGAGGLVRRSPMLAAAGGSAVGYGLNSFLNRDPFGSMPDTSFLPPGNYSPAGNQASYDQQLATREPGIFAANKERLDAMDRVAALQPEIASGRGGGNAYAEMRAKERRIAELNKTRDEQVGKLNTVADGYQQRLDKIRERQGSLEGERTAWWSAPKRWFTKATGGNPDLQYDKQIGQLYDLSAQTQTQRQLALDQAKLMQGGSTARSNTPSAPPSDAALQSTFFPPTR